MNNDKVLRINENIKYKKTVCIIYISLVLGLLFYDVLGGYIGLETNDDTFLAIIPSGWLGGYYPYTIHNNIIIGYFLAAISRVLSMYNCTTLFYLGIMSVSFILLGIVIVEKKGAIIGGLFSFAFVATTWLSLLNRMNYSKSGALAIIVGCLTFAFSMEWDRTKNVRMLFEIIGLTLLIIGALVRYKTDLAFIPYIVILGVFFFAKHDKKNYKATFLAALLIIVFGWIFDYSVYHSDDYWKEYKEYNDIREQLMDYGIPEYYGNEDIYQQLGLNENDYEMLINWQYADEKVFSIDVFKSLLRYRKSIRPHFFSVYTLKLVLRRFISNIQIFPQIGVASLLCALAYFTTKGNKKKIIFLFCTMWLELVYLMYTGRTPERAVMIPVIATIPMLIFFYIPDTNKIGLISLSILLISIYCFCVCVLADNNELKKNELIIQKEVNDIYEKLSHEEDNLYVWHIFTASRNLTYSQDLFSGYPYGQHKNSVFSGGWLVPSPLMADISGRYGERNNVYKLLAFNPNVFYVVYTEDSINGIGADAIERYIRDHYNKDARATLVEKVGIYSIYSFCENN